MVRLTTHLNLDGPLLQQEDPANRIPHHAAAVNGLAIRSPHSSRLGAFPQPPRHRAKDVPHHEEESEKLKEPRHRF
jgi:hypothetical protein